MPRFILIHESTRHACYVTTDEIISLVDVRRNPAGGYTDTAKCLAMIENPEGGRYQAFPLLDTPNGMGAATIHVEGRLDMKGHGLVWKEAGHRCDMRCALPGLPQRRQRF